MNSWIEKIEKYFDDIPLAQQPEVRDFLEEYYEKKDTHSATSLDGLSDEELGELLYLELESFFLLDINEKNFFTKLEKCTKLQILDVGLQNIDFQYISQFKNLRILNLEGKLSNYSYFSSLNKLIVFRVFTEEKTEILITKTIFPSHLLFFSVKGELDEKSIYKINKFPILSELVYLELYGVGIGNFPDLSAFKNLVSLNLNFNPIKEIPPYFHKLKKLRELYLYCCKISKIPNNFIGLKNLTTLNIAQNKLKTVPNELFKLPMLNQLNILTNPFEGSKLLDFLNTIVNEDFQENEIFVLDILKNQKAVTQEDYNYFTLKVPKVLQTPMLQYIEFFKDYVEATKGKDIIFDVKRDKEGLVLVTNGNVGVTLLDLSSYFQEYVSLVGQNTEDWILNFEVPQNAVQADILRLKLDRQITSLKSDLEIARLESKFLSRELGDAQAQISFLKELSQSLSKNINDLVNHQSIIQEPNADKLLLDLIDQAVKMLERKDSHYLENLHNDVLTDFLRGQNYYATDQTRSGKAKIGAGELDIMIRKRNGTPYSIIEAFRLASCGEKNRVVAQHIDKLIHDYDTAGHARNFIIVYAEAENFGRLWENYSLYISEINGKSDFRAKYPLINFAENKNFSKKSNIKIGLAKHRREGDVVEIYHIFINMFGGLR